MKNKTILQSLIQECLKEVRNEKKTIKLSQLKEALRGPVREVLKEGMASAGKTVGKEDKAEKEKIDKGYNKNGNEKLDKTNEKLLKEMESLVHGINSDWDVYWDDNNQLVVHAENLVSVRIAPKFENNFDMEIMVKLVDRIRVIAQTWEQIKETVKANLNDLSDDSIAHKAQADQQKKSSSEGEKGKDAGPRHDITKVKKVGDSSKDNKDFNEKAVTKDEDEPSAPMKDVGEPKSLNKNVEKTTQVKPPKHKKVEGDEKLKVELDGTTKYRIKKS
jgi:hypothetical protein